MAHILIVDDEINIRKVVREYAEFEGYEVTEAENGMEAVNLCHDNNYDLIIMDVMMPRLDGYSACKEIRKTKNIPVIMLSARGEEYDKLFGFEIGIDDYVVKPFSPKELMARVKVALKRNTTDVNSGKLDKYVFEGLEVDISGREVYVNHEKASMTPKEYDLLFFLVRNKNIALSRDQLLEEVWGYDFFGDDRTVDTHIKRVSVRLGFSKEKDEGELTQIKSSWVDKKHLSRTIKLLDLGKYIRVGTKNVKKGEVLSDSLQEDLCESIIGAVAVDCNWNFDVLFKLCFGMLDVTEFSDHTVRMLCDGWKDKGYKFPTFTKFTPKENMQENKFYQQVKIAELGISFIGCDDTVTEAKMAASMQALNYCKKIDMQNEVGKPKITDAINQLQELFHKEEMLDKLIPLIEYHHKYPITDQQRLVIIKNQINSESSGPDLLKVYNPSITLNEFIKMLEKKVGV